MTPIAEFQQDHGLASDGVIGRITTAKMRQVWGLKRSELAHFLGQCHVESGGFLHREENLNYSASRLLEIFPRYFTSLMAQRYAYNPEMIANIAYSMRIGNGDICSGDGYRYRGRGCLQLTGKDNYRELGKVMGVDCLEAMPEIVAGNLYWKSGLKYFDSRDIWHLCQDISSKNIEKVTVKVNGGLTALSERTKWTNYYYSLF